MRPSLKALAIVVATVLALRLASAKAEKVMRPKFADIRLWSDEKFISHDFKVDASDPHVNITLKVLQQLHSVDLHVDAFVAHKQDPEHFFAVNTTINFCNILHYNTKSPVGSLLVMYLKQYGKLLEKCPIKKGSYYLHKFWLPDDTALSHFEEVDFKLHLTATHVDAKKQKTLIIDDHIGGEMTVQDVKNIKPGFLAVLPRTI